MVSAVDENQINTGSIPGAIETFPNNGRIDHLWVINSLISQYFLYIHVYILYIYVIERFFNF